MTKRLTAAAFAALLIVTACHKKARVGVDLDLYLHAESSALDDTILRSAIRKRLHDNSATQNAAIQVQVTQRVVFLSGRVNSRATSDTAAQIAQNTEAVINGEVIKTSEPVHNQIEIAH